MTAASSWLVPVDGTRRLHLSVSGSGAPLLALHGFTGCGETLAGTLRGLGDGWRHLLVDLVGHGRSDPPAALEDCTMQRCVADLAALLDALGEPSVHLLGYSMGGRVALAFAAAWPGRVRSAVLVGARAGFEDPAERAARRAADEDLADRIEARGLAWFVEHWMALPLFASQRRLGAGALAAARAQRLRNDPRCLALSLRGMGAGAQPPLHGSLSRLRMPVLLAVGAEDAPFAAVARDLAARLPEARIAEIPGAGHAAHLENPEPFARTVRAFLSDAEAAWAARAARAGGPASPPHEEIAHP